MPIFSSGGQFGGGLQNPQFGGGMPNKPYKWDPLKNTYVAPTNPATFPGQTGQTGNPMSYWEELLKKQFGQGQTAGQVKTPTMQNNWQNYISQGATPISAQNVTAQNVNAPQMSQDYLKYLNAGTQAINAAGLQDTGALLRSYDPILQQQQEQGFSQAAMRAGKTGMWGSPYAQALGAEAGKASNQRANIANQYLYQASEQAANRQLQAEMQNRANQLQAAGLSAQQAQAQAQMEMQASLANQSTGLQAGMANQSANLQAQIQSRQNQLQAGGLSADQAYRQAQLEMQGQLANQQAGQNNLNQMISAYGAIGQQQLGQGQLDLSRLQNQQGQLSDAMNRFLQQYGDIQSPDELWNYMSGLYGQGGTNLPQYAGSYQQPTVPTQYNQNLYNRRQWGT